MKFSAFIQRSRTWLTNLTVGGAWGRTLRTEQQHNLRWFWFDGLFASASENIIINFISLYILALGASEAQVGLMSSFSSVTGALVLLPAALLAERVTRKKMVPFLASIGARSSILLLIFVPILFKGPLAIWIAIAFSVLRDAFNNVGFPAWMAVTNEIVPIEGRGRYFGSRNFIMNIAGMAATLLAGKLITIIVAPIGFQVALAVALVLGISSTFSYFHIQEEPASENPPVSQRVTFRNLIAMFKDQPQFIALTLTAALWNFAINIAGPFFNVQMVQNLKFSAASVGFLAVVMSLTGLLTQNQVGALADRVGARRLQLISMCLIPILPLAWIFATQVWHIALINLFSGVFWGAFNLVSFNLLLNSVPQSQVPRYSAVYQVVVMLSLALGALVGSAVITRWGFIAVVIASSATRFIAAGLFARFVRDPRQPTQAK